MKITADSGIPFLRGVLEPYAEVEYIAGSDIDAAAVRDSDALIIRTRTRCDAALLERSRVQFIATATIGFDHIDTEYCRSRGIAVATAAGCNSRGVLQWVAAALAVLARREGWRPEQRTLGIAGVGHIGSLVADYAHRWGFRVLCCDPPRQRTEHGDWHTIGQLARQCDIITFHVPLQRTGEDATWHLAGERFFSCLKRGADIINASRGEVVDNALLREAVAEGRCSCCLDVWENEPDIDRDLLRSAIVATPHIAGYSLQGKANAASMSVAALARHFSLPLGNYYPEQVRRIAPRAIDWPELLSTIDLRCDLEAESRTLREAPERFEALRNGYRFREEYF